MVADAASSFDVTYVRLPKNIGRGPARNMGAEKATGDYILFLDADVEVPPTILDQVKEAIKAAPHEEAFFGSYDDDPGCPKAVSQYRNLLHYYTHQIADDYALHFWTGFGVVKTSVFRDIGGFDLDKWARNMEEVDIGFRLNAAGHRIRLYKDLQLKHLKSYTLVSMFKSDFFDRAIPWTLYIRENHTPSNAYVTSARQKLSAISVVLILIVFLYPLFGLPVLITSLLGGLWFVILNTGFFSLCYKKHGVIFMVQAVFLHIVHIFSAGFGYVMGSLLYAAQSVQRFFRKNLSLFMGNLRVSSKSNVESEK